jgi:predicted negative regulator of RcsB-dependent stress response
MGKESEESIIQCVRRLGMTEKKPVDDPMNTEDHSALKAEMNELKREMRSAKWGAWAQDNKQSLLAGLVLLVLAMLGGGLWIENDRSNRASAAILYQQALSEQDLTTKTTLLENVSSDFSGSSYGALALMQLARVDTANTAAHLQALINHSKAMEEWVWQARLDLAELNIEQGNAQAARKHLEQPVGKQYEQLRHYLMAEISVDAAEKEEHLKKALDAPSLDEGLKRKIESQLATKSS